MTSRAAGQVLDVLDRPMRLVWLPLAAAPVGVAALAVASRGHALFGAVAGILALGVSAATGWLIPRRRTSAAQGAAVDATRAYRVASQPQRGGGLLVDTPPTVSPGAGVGQPDDLDALWQAIGGSR